MSRPDPSGEADPLPEAVRGLEDPRDLHPSPEGVFNEPAGSSESGPAHQGDPSPSGDDHATEDEGRGIVGPRIETIGPDL